MLTPVSRFYKAQGAPDILINKIEESFERLKKGHIITPVTEEEEKTLLLSDYVSDGNELRPFVVDGKEFYLQKNYLKQAEILTWIKERANKIDLHSFEQVKTVDFKSLVHQLFNDSDALDWQKIGAINCFINSFSILSGGPGTGKTTTVAKFLALTLSLNSKLKSIALVAQTAKAAARLNESLNNQHQTLIDQGIDPSVVEVLKNIQPSTIHRLLKTDPRSLGGQFLYNASNPLPHDIVLIDEASMVDLNLMHKLFTAIKPSTKVVMMGDKNQLSPVEAGSVFADITKAMAENIFPKSFDFLCDHGLPKEHLQNGKLNVMVQLKKTYRFNGKSQIFDVSQDVLNYEFEVANCSNYTNQNKSDEGSVFFLGADENYKQVLKEQVLFFKKYIQEVNITEALKNINAVRVLCATKSGDFGVYEMNKRVEQILQSNTLIKKEKEFYHNQLIMITKNNSQLGVNNGDVGIVRLHDGKLMFYLEDKSSEKGYRDLPVAYLDDWETAYAMTIHKSQGSEFNQVIVSLPEHEENRVLSKELLYTAITRSKNQVFLIGTEKVTKACATISTQKASGIQQRLQNN